MMRFFFFNGQGQGMLQVRLTIGVRIRGNIGAMKRVIVMLELKTGIVVCTVELLPLPSYTHPNSKS